MSNISVSNPNHFVKISQRPIDIQRAFDFTASPSHGGNASFLGTIRQHNLGKKVVGVSYDVLAPLAEKIIAQLCCQAEAQWGDALKFYIEHYQGRLAVGEVSVIIAVSSPHRDEAFKACRYLIDEIKLQAPIWKQEHYIDGNSEWVKGHALCQK
ncbi:MAG: molybdenum cofactor biosynthesis protein MoaE [Gammaproteobacteria bacterium]|nr:molybdenum cofactor biosynthesis protein MoaE [Gammaproteobacteria bacterium]